MEIIKTKRKFMAIACIMGGLAVIFGAFGAHWLANNLAAKQLSSFKTGVLYHFIHVFAILFVISNLKKESEKGLIWAARFFLIGIFCFSGSLYLLSTRELLGLTFYKWLGPITPIGGLFFILAWFSAAKSFLTRE